MTTTEEREASTGRRERMKSDRRRKLLDAAARLIAQRGFLGVRLEDLGAAAGISGPAVYRHFPNKDAVLVELLVGISSHLQWGGTKVVEEAPTSLAALDALVDFHLDFAMQEPDLIRIQDRDLQNLPASAHKEVRLKQRQYVELWVHVLLDLNRGLTSPEARTKAHAVFGLLNSTPHSANPDDLHRTRTVLRRMALAALAA